MPPNAFRKLAQQKIVQRATDILMPWRLLVHGHKLAADEFDMLSLAVFATKEAEFR